LNIGGRKKSGHAFFENSFDFPQLLHLPVSLPEMFAVLAV
jgi:hypothetical protein